jgi:hypothetical protein
VAADHLKLLLQLRLQLITQLQSAQAVAAAQLLVLTVALVLTRFFQQLLQQLELAELVEQTVTV